MKKDSVKKQTKKVTLVESVMATMKRRKASVNDYFTLITCCDAMIDEMKEEEVKRIDATIEELQKQRETLVRKD